MKSAPFTDNRWFSPNFILLCSCLFGFKLRLLVCTGVPQNSLLGPLLFLLPLRWTAGLPETIPAEFRIGKFSSISSLNKTSWKKSTATFSKVTESSDQVSATQEPLRPPPHSPPGDRMDFENVSSERDKDGSCQHFMWWQSWIKAGAARRCLRQKTRQTASEMQQRRGGSGSALPLPVSALRRVGRPQGGQVAPGCSPTSRNQADKS